MYAQVFFQREISLATIWITFGTTFILYNTQQLFLGFLILKDVHEKKVWAEKNKIVLQLIFLTVISLIYPLYKSCWQFLLTYVIAGIISFLYFLPFSNLRAVPFLKSFIIGLVWVLICVIAPIEPDKIDRPQIIFGVSQLLFITALCVLFNIRDMEQDKKTGTHTIPVLYGIKRTKVFTIILLLGYLWTCYYLKPDFMFMLVSLIVFLLSCFFTMKSAVVRHFFYFLLGVDGLILLQSILGIVILKR
jgi:4-hydroxybenzoate polyprenyltransferase